MHSLADSISVRNPAGGVKRSRPGLVSENYKKSAVSATLKRLVDMGIIVRIRQGRKGSYHEEFAITAFSNVVLEASTEWNQARLLAKKKGKPGVNADLEKIAIQISPKSTGGSGEPTFMRAAEGQRPNFGLTCVQNLETVSFITPPQAALTPVPALVGPVSAEPVPALVEPVPVSAEPVPALVEPVPVEPVPVEPVPALVEPVPVEPVPALVEPVPVLGGCEERSKDRPSKTERLQRRSAEPPLKDPAKKRPLFYDEDLKDFRRFTSWFFLANQNNDTLTSIHLIRPSARGRMEVFGPITKSKSLGRPDAPAGLTGVDPAQLFSLAYDKSAVLFQECGEGEQVFFAPREKSRVVLLDDLKTPDPLYSGTPAAVLETSQDNFQHLYVLDQNLSAAQRASIQAQLARAHGADQAATSGGQPHRCPGSVNYKPGRNLFVTRLVHVSTTGIPLRTDTFDCAGYAASPATPTTQSGRKSIDAAKPPAAGSTQSESDWKWCLRNKQLGRERLIAELSKTAAQRGKYNGYAELTVDQVIDCSWVKEHRQLGRDDLLAGLRVFSQAKNRKPGYEERTIDKALRLSS